MMRGWRGVLLCVIGMMVLPAGWPVAAQENCAPPQLRMGWTTDFCNSSVDLDEILNGGPGKDGIPALTDPAVETVTAAATWLAPHSPVIVVEVAGVARAYPLAILMWHEIANDTVNGVPVAVTFCPLCNSAIVFDRRVDEAVLEFGVSGLLRNSDMIMYDRQTESWWQQFTGTGIIGAYNGTLLTIIPTQLVGFGAFAAAFPQGEVLSRETGHRRSYGVNPYAGYDASEYPFLYSGAVDERLPPFEYVLAGTVDAVDMAYPFSALSQAGLINDTLGTTAVVALWQPGMVTALDERTIDDSRDIGTAVLFNRTVAGQTLTFRAAGDGTITDAETGSTWSLWGEAMTGPLAGQRLTRLAAAPHFWFAWAAFHPQTAIYQP
ncbi:MAG: DUF3179 domain-containing protein [Anaerolineae bacterium]|nr:DUF3179 domain-containing protein [Anaerolineae bacterium]